MLQEIKNISISPNPWIKMNLFIPFTYNLKNCKDNAFLTARKKKRKRKGKERKGEIMVLKQYQIWFCDSQPTGVTWLTAGRGRQEEDGSPLGKLFQCLQGSAVNKRAQWNSGLERTSLSLIVRKRGGKKQNKKRKSQEARCTKMRSQIAEQFHLTDKLDPYKCKLIFISGTLCCLFTDYVPCS